MPTLADISGVLGIDVNDFVGGISQAEAKLQEFGSVMQQAVQSYNDLAGAIRMESQVQQQAAALMASVTPQTSFTQAEIEALHQATEAKRADAQAAVSGARQQEQVYGDLSRQYVQNIGQMSDAERQFLQLQIDVARAQAAAGVAAAQQEVTAFKAAKADETQAVRAAAQEQAQADRAARQLASDAARQLSQDQAQAARSAAQASSDAARQAAQAQAAATQQLTSATSGLTQALNQAGVPAQALVSGFMQGAQAITLMGSSAPPTETALLGLSSAEMGVITTTLLLIQGLTQAANAYVSYADQIRNTAAMTGLSEKMAEGLDAAFRANGINAGQATLALGQMSEKAANLARDMEQGKAPAGNFADALAKLGIDARAFTTASMDEQVLMLSNGLAQHRGEVDATGLAYDVLGRYGKQMSVVMQEGAPYILGWADKVVKSGADVSQNQAQVLGWHKSLTDLHIEIQAVENQLGSGFIPVAKAGVDVLSKGAEVAHAAFAAWNSLPKPVQELGTVLPAAAVGGMALVVAFSAISSGMGVLGGLVAPLAAAWSTFTAQVSYASAALAGEAVTAETAAAATAALVPELAIVAALGIGLFLVLHNLTSGADDAAAAEKRFGDAVDKTTSYLEKQAHANIAAGVSPAAEIDLLTQKYNAAETQLNGYLQRLDETKSAIAALSAVQSGHMVSTQQIAAATAAYQAVLNLHIGSVHDLGSAIAYLKGQQSELNGMVTSAKTAAESYDNVVHRLQNDQSQSATAAEAAAKFYAGQAESLGIAASSALTHATALEAVDKAVQQAGQSTAAGIAFQEASNRAVEDASRSDADWAQRRAALIAIESSGNPIIDAAAKLEVELGDAYRLLGPAASQAAVAQQQAAQAAQQADQAQRQLASGIKQSADESTRFEEAFRKLGPLLETATGQAAQQEVALWRQAMAQVYADDVALTQEMSAEDRKRLEAARTADMAQATIFADAAQQEIKALQEVATADKQMNDSILAQARTTNDDIVRLTERRAEVQHQLDTLVDSSAKASAQSRLEVEAALIDGIKALEAMRLNSHNVYLSAILAAELGAAKARLGLAENEAQQAIQLNNDVHAAAQQGARGELAVRQGLFEAQERIDHLTVDERARGEAQTLQNVIAIDQQLLAAYLQLKSAETAADIAQAKTAIEALELQRDAALQAANQIRTMSQDATKDTRLETSAISEQTAQIKDLTQANQDLFTAEDHLHTLDTKRNNQTIAQLQEQLAAITPVEQAQRAAATTAEQGAVAAAQGYRDMVAGMGMAEGAAASLGKAMMANAGASTDAVIKDANDQFETWNHTYTRESELQTALDRQQKQLADAQKTYAKDVAASSAQQQSSVLDLMKTYESFTTKVVQLQGELGPAFDRAGAAQVLAVSAAVGQEEQAVQVKTQRVLALERQLTQDLAPEDHQRVQDELESAQASLDLERGKYAQMKQLASEYTSAFLTQQQALASSHKAVEDAAVADAQAQSKYYQAIMQAELGAAQAAQQLASALRQNADDEAQATVQATEKITAAWKTAMDNVRSANQDAAQAAIAIWQQSANAIMGKGTPFTGAIIAELSAEIELDHKIADAERTLAAVKTKAISDELNARIALDEAKNRLASAELDLEIAKANAAESIASAQLNFDLAKDKATRDSAVNLANAQIQLSGAQLAASLLMFQGMIQASTDWAIASTTDSLNVAKGLSAATDAGVAHGKVLAADAQIAGAAVTPTAALVSTNASLGQVMALVTQVGGPYGQMLAGIAQVATAAGQALSQDFEGPVREAAKALAGASASGAAAVTAAGAAVVAAQGGVTEAQHALNQAMIDGQTAIDGATSSLNGLQGQLDDVKNKLANLNAEQSVWQSMQGTGSALAENFASGGAVSRYPQLLDQAAAGSRSLASATSSVGSASQSAAGDLVAFNNVLASGTTDAVKLQGAFDKLFSGASQELTQMTWQASVFTLQMAQVNQAIGVAPVSQNLAKELEIQAQIADLKAQAGPGASFAPSQQQLDLETQEAQLQEQMDQLQLQLAQDTLSKHMTAAAGVQRHIDLLTKQENVIKDQIAVLNQQTTVQKDQNTAATNGTNQQIAALQRQYDQLQLNDAKQQADFKAQHAGQLQQLEDLKAQAAAVKLDTDVYKAQQDQLKANADAQKDLTDVTLLSIKQMENAYKEFVDYLNKHVLTAVQDVTSAASGGGAASGAGTISGTNVYRSSSSDLQLLTAGGTGYAPGTIGQDSPFTGIASYAEGTNYVPEDQLALVHRGEAVIPASENTGRGGLVIDVSGGIHLHIQGSTNMKPAQVAAAAKAGVRAGLAEEIRRGQLLSGRRNG